MRRLSSLALAVVVLSGPAFADVVAQEAPASTTPAAPAPAGPPSATPGGDGASYAERENQAQAQDLAAFQGGHEEHRHYYLGGSVLVVVLLVVIIVILL